MTEKIGRNDPCHCGSGLKYKKCHATADDAARSAELAAQAAARTAAREAAEQESEGEDGAAAKSQKTHAHGTPGASRPQRPRGGSSVPSNLPRRKAV